MSGTGDQGEPACSVIVTLTTGETTAIASALQSLSRQEHAPGFEILVPHPAGWAGARLLREVHPEVRFLPVNLEPASIAAQRTRQHHDVLRSAGLRAARGSRVALVEDQAICDPHWLAGILEAFAAAPEAVAVGGAVECQNAGVVGTCLWISDFLRYARPFEVATVAAVSDTNVVYRHDALLEIETVWSAAYHEPAVHAALLARGGVIVLTPAAVTYQARARMSLLDGLRERVVWGRSFGGPRARTWSPIQRGCLTLAMLLLPFYLLARILAASFLRRRLLYVLVRVPVLLPLLVAWSYGEALGTWTGSTQPHAGVGT